MTQLSFPSDGELVAFLDGELASLDHAKVAQHLSVNAEAQKRLLLLAEGGRPFREALDALLAEAPNARLERMLSGLPGLQAASVAQPAKTPWRRSAMAIAASLTLFCSGIAFDHLWSMVKHANEPQEIEAIESGSEWRQAVAEYLALYTGETLASIPNDEQMRRGELATVAAKVGVPLSLERISLPHLDFKRAQLLQYGGKPLGQLAYLAPQNGPAFLCIIANGEPDSAQRSEQREGFRIVYWSRGGRAFMLIGQDEMSKLQSLASTLSQRISG